MALAEIGARLRLQGADAYRRDATRAADATGRLDREADAANRSVGKLGKAADKAKRGLGGLRGAGSLASGFLGGIAGSAAVGFLSDTISLASDLNETMGKTQVIFGDSTPKVMEFAKGAAQSIGATKQEALDAASTFGSLFQSFGNSKGDVDKMSLGLVGLAGDLASFNNASTSEALDAIRSGLLGESDPLQRFQINLSAAAIEAEAMSSGLVKMQVDSTKLKTAQLALASSQDKLVKTNKSAKATDLDRAKALNAVKVSEQKLKDAMGGKKVELTNAQKAQATYNLIMRQSKSAQGDFKRTSDGLANSQRILKATFTNTKTEIGMKLLPIVNDFMRRFSVFITQMQDGTGAGGEFADQMRGLGSFTEGAYKKLKPVVEWMADHKEVVLGFAAALVAVKVGMAGLAAVNALRAAAGIAAVGTAASTSTMAIMGPAGLIAALVALEGYSLYTGSKITDGRGTAAQTGIGDRTPDGTGFANINPQMPMTPATRPLPHVGPPTLRDVGKDGALAGRNAKGVGGSSTGDLHVTLVTSEGVLAKGVVRNFQDKAARR